MKFKTLACTVHKICHASKSVTDTRTDGQAKSNMPHQLFQSLGHNESPYFVKRGQISLFLGLLPICVDFPLLHNRKDMTCIRFHSDFFKGA